LNDLVALFSIAVGIGVLGMWTVSLVRHQVPELATKPWEIRTHITAETIMAVTAVAGGVSTLLDLPQGPAILMFGLGMIVYSIINSSGYYLQRRQPVPVVMFAVLLALVVLAAAAELGAIIGE